MKITFLLSCLFFFFNDTATTEIYTLSLHDALPIFEGRGLRRTFKGGIEAVRDIDLAVAEGEIFGFLGPNGAGKTTTVRMFCTLLPPTAGSARVAGPHGVGDEAEGWGAVAPPLHGGGRATG